MASQETQAPSCDPSDTDPVSPDEFVLRRVLRRWYDPSKDPHVDPQAFRPTLIDKDGLSVFRANFAKPEKLDRDRETGNPGTYYVAQLRASAIMELDLTIIPDPKGELPGHALIPELKTGLSGDAKRRAKEKQYRLAKLASGGIIYEPPSE